MQRSRLLAGAVLACAGCAPILGIEDVTERSADASPDVSGNEDAPSGASSDASVVDVSASDVADAAPFDASGDADADAAACTNGTFSCDGETRRECVGGQWVNRNACAAVCRRGDCVTPSSCLGLTATCGANLSCCSTRTLPAIDFKRSYDGVQFVDGNYAAKIGSFMLDVFEVTVGRFRAFVAAYNGGAKQPATGSGKNAKDASDQGWLAAHTESLPPDEAALRTALGCSGGTFTATAGANEKLPVNCVDWFTAYAFCIWDGGRLPTEAEWNAAASGGAQQRVYPWSQPAQSTAISATNAVYGVSAPLDVGSKGAGDGRYFQADLAGNVAEWTRDLYATPYSSTSCDDCSNSSAGTTRVIRGGAFNDPSTAVYAAGRNDATPTRRSSAVGFRCARDL